MNSLDEYNEGVIVPSNQLKLVLTTIDVKKKKNVFLHGDLEEKVYMDVLLGFSHKTWANKVCQLKKFLYRLK